MPIKLLSEFAKIPQKKSAKAAGYDLFSAINTTIFAKSVATVPTDLAIQVPTGCYGRIAMRSGLAVGHLLSISGGVIDQDYTGNVKIIIINHGKDDFIINRGDRIAQLIIEKISHPNIEIVDHLKESIRGENGFGSTGRN